MTSIWPKALQSARGPFPSDKLDGAAAGMGEWGLETRALAAAGIVPPDMMTGLTLFLLANQPRDPAARQDIPGGAGGVAGGVWVRERFTIHRPLAREEPFVVNGQSEGRHVHKARRYGTTSSVTTNGTGELVGSNLTTGLLAYRIQEGLADSVEGRSPDEVEAPAPDWEAAAANPCRAHLAQLREGQSFGGEPVCVRLDLMKARDTARPDNPIHSDPEMASRAGLSKPIAGGSHVLAFALEEVMGAAGRDALLHGANFDVRWKAPVYADLVIHPHARVTERQDDRVVFEVDATLQSGAAAMVGRIVVPLA